MKLHFECNLNAALAHMANRKFAINKCHDNVIQGLPQRVAQRGKWGGGGGRQEGAALATCQATKSNSFFIDKTFACCSQGKQQGAPQPRPLSAMPQKVMYMER